MWASIISGIAVVVSIAALVYQIARNHRDDQDKSIDGLRTDLNALKAEQIELKAKISLFWAVMEKHALTILHHPNTPTRDKLIEAYADGKLGVEGLQEFIHLLQEVVENNSLPSGERMAASMLLLSIQAKHGVVIL